MRTNKTTALAVVCFVLIGGSWNARGQFQIGLYKDGKLVDTFGSVTQPQGGTNQSKAAGLASKIPSIAAAPVVSDETLQRNQVFIEGATLGVQIHEALREMKAAAGVSNALQRQDLPILLNRFVARQEQARATFTATGNRLLELRLPPEIYQRHLDTVATFEMAYAEFTNVMNDVITSKSGALENALKLMDQVNFHHEPDLTRAGPTRIPMLIQAAPELTTEQADALLTSDVQKAAAKSASAIKTLDSPTPAYGASTPIASDLGETPDVRLTTEIRAKAATLGNSPYEIYNFVRNKVAFQPYLGSRKGAVNTLRQLAGNDTDQASLLIALLRAANIPCRYVRGTVEMTPAQARSWLGVDDTITAGNILMTASLNGVNVTSGTNIVAVRSTRVWVQAYIPYSNYRGVPNEKTGFAWIPLDPAFKENIITQGEDVLTAMGFNNNTFLTNYVSTYNSNSPMEVLEQNIQSWLNTNSPGKQVADIKRTVALRPQDLGLLPASLPNTLLAAGSPFSELSDTNRYKVRLHLYDGGTTFIDFTTNLSELAGHAVTIGYIGATTNDQAVINAHGGIYQTPPYLVQVKPVLKVDGNPVVTSSSAIGMGYTHNSDMQFIQPTGEQNQQPVIYNTITAGNGQAIAFDTFLDVPNFFLSGTNAVPDSLLSSLLQTTAVDYLSRVDRGEEKGDSLLRTVHSVDVSEVIAESSVAVTFSLGGVPQTFTWTGMTVDADRRIVSSFAVNGDSSKKYPFMLLTGFDGSFMENDVFEDMYNQRAVSTIRILQLASDQGIPLCTISNSISSACPGFNHPSSVLSAVNNALAQGHVVIIPRQEITVSNWTGTGYIDLNPATGTAGYIISGGISGNVMAAGGATVGSWTTTLDCPVFDCAVNNPQAGAIYCADSIPLVLDTTIFLSCGGDLNMQQWHINTGYTMKGLAEKYGGGNYTISISADGNVSCTSAFTVVDVESLLPDKGQEIDDGDSDDNTHTYIVAYSETAGNKVTITAKPGPAIAEVNLPACWAFTGGDAVGAGKLQRTIPQTTTGKTVFTCQSGLRKKTTIVYVIKVDISKAPTEDATGNRYGYDDFDTPPKDNDDHVSVEKGQSTFVHVTISGGDNNLNLDFKAKDNSIANVDTVPSPLPADFLLKVQGKGTGGFLSRGAETMIEVLPQGKTSPVLASLRANVYRLLNVGLWNIYRVTDSTSAGTSPLNAISEATIKTFANSIVKQGVMNFADVKVEDKDIRYDRNGNGVLDWYFDNGTQPEHDEIIKAGLSGSPKLVVVKRVNFCWRLSAAAPTGTNRIVIQGNYQNFINGWLSEDYTLGTGANQEAVIVTAVNGNLITLSGPLTRAHDSGEDLAKNGGGVSADPQIILDNDPYRDTGILHETLHRVANLLDVENTQNIMHWRLGPDHDQLRYKPLPRKYNPPGGTENQWDTILHPIF